jgi:hypothetical protein
LRSVDLSTSKVRFCLSVDIKYTAKPEHIVPIASICTMKKIKDRLMPYSGLKGFLLVDADQNIVKATTQMITT